MAPSQLATAGSAGTAGGDPGSCGQTRTQAGPRQAHGPSAVLSGPGGTGWGTAMPADPAAASSRAASGDHGRFEDMAEVTFTTHRPRSVVIAQTVASLRPPRREGGPAGRPSRNTRVTST